MTVEFQVSFFSTKEAADFEAKTASIGIQSFNMEDWTGSDWQNNRGHSPEIHLFYEMEEQKKVEAFENLFQQIQGIRVVKDDSDAEDKVILVEAIATTDREQHRLWCDISEEDYTFLFGSASEEEEARKHLDEYLPVWFGLKPAKAFFALDEENNATVIDS